MTAGAPWSVKGINPKAREVAKDLARRSGMTLGEWLNQVILQDDGPEEVTSESYFADRGSRAYIETPRIEAAAAPPLRFEAPQHPGDEIHRMATALDRLTQRIEASEARTGQAITGVELSVREAVGRIEQAEREHVAVAARFEGAVTDTQTEHARLADRLRRMEQEAAGPRSAAALKSLEQALGKVAGHLYDGESRNREMLGAMATRVARLESHEPSDPATLVETVIARVGERLSEAEGRTADALEALRHSFAALDGRLSPVENGVGPAVERRLEDLAANLTNRLEAARGEMAEKLRATAEGRFDRFEATLGEMAEQVRAAEQQSAQAIERMGQEVMTIADGLTQRVQTAETRSAEAIEQVGGEVARIAQSMEQRFTRSDTVQAQALERLGGEIARITERLAERIANAERRSAQAIDDVGEQVARVTERINLRADRTSEDLSERIRQSEERTAKLLEEAREKIDRRLAETQGRTAEASPAPAFNPGGAFLASGGAAASPFAADPFASLGPAEPDLPPAETPAHFAAEPEVAAFPAPEPERPDFALEDYEAAASFPSPSIAKPDPSPEPVAGHLFDPPPVSIPAFEATRFGASFTFEAPADLEPEPEAEPPAAPEIQAEADADAQSPTAPEGPAAFGPAGFDADDDFGEPAAAAETPEPDLSVESVFEDGATGFEIDAMPEDPAPPQKPLSTREVVEQARAAARAAAQGGEVRGKKLRLTPKSEKVAKPASAPLFSGFGVGRSKRRANSTLQTFLLVSGGAAFLGLAAGGIALMEAKPSGAPPKRVADALAALQAPAPVAGQEIDTTPFPSRAAVALAPQPMSVAPAPAAPAETGDLPGLYADAVRAVDAGEPGGLEALRKTANLGHAPAQFYLGKLYETGASGVKKDLAEARRWTERAAEGGDRRAMHNLALYYFHGEGGPKNSTTAAQWFRRAADLGLVDSQYNLGRLYEEGLGVSQNAAEAYKWYLIAARAGDGESRTSAERSRGQLSAEAKTVAERAAAGFRASAPGPAPLQQAQAEPGSLLTAQRALSRLGYYQGPTDGSASPALRLAVAAYQRDQGLAATGALDATTVSRLAVFTH